MACLLEPKGIEAKCPYCEDMRFWVECPQEQQSKPEVECLPYTRDIGKFDDGKWTQIGSDFHSTILGWERIGILYTTPGQKVFYRVVGCHQCNYLFEVYANYTFRQLDKLRFAEMWPHLFKSRGDRIKKYKKETLTKRILDNYSLTSFFHAFYL